MIISMAGKPVAKLVPYDADSYLREFGVGNWKGKIQIADDLPNDVLELVAGESDDESASWHSLAPQCPHAVKLLRPGTDVS